MSDLRETAKYIDAHKFVKWLIDLYGEERVTGRIGICGGDRWSRRWFHWRNECATGLINIEKVDEFLVEVFMGDLFLSDLPDDCFTASERRWSRSTEAVRADACRLVAEGRKPKDVAYELGVSPSTVQKWRRTAKAA